jgi:hypothetical protein
MLLLNLYGYPPSRVSIPLWCVSTMTDTSVLPDTTVGNNEPTASRMMLTLMVVAILGFFALFSNIFGWDNIPLLGEIVPLIGNLGGGGIWYYLLGFIIGIGAIVATLVGEILVDCCFHFRNSPRCFTLFPIPIPL